MLHFHHKLPAGGAALLLAFLLHGCAVQAASLPRHWLRGGGSEGQPAAFQPSSDMIKALEYIENLKQRNGGRPEPVDYDEVEKFKVLLQLASRQDEVPGDRQSAPGIQRPDVTAEQLLKAMLRTLQDQGGREAGFPHAASEPRSDRRTQRHRAKEVPGSAPADFGNFPRPHKKYPLMFEDEENADASKRATEDLDEQYTPQSLANLRSIFDELGRMPSLPGQKRGVFGEEEEEEEEGGNGFGQRNQAYDDVAGGEEWVPVEEREETEEVVNRSHEEMERALSDQEESEREETQRRADQNQEDADDDTKLVDYYLLKVLEMSDQTQKRDQTGEQKRLIRPSIVDPRTVKELLQLSLKLHVPPQDLIDMLLTEELRKLHRDPQALSRYTTAGQTPKIRYFSRRLPLKAKPPTPTGDLDREDFLDIIGVETISNEYPVVQRPMKTTSAADRIQTVSSPAGGSAGAVKIPPPSGRRENLFLSELNKMPLKRQSDTAADDDDDGDVEDEVTTYLAAKILTEYPNTISKRDTRAQLKGQFPYELYERAVKDYMEQAQTETRPGGPEGATEEKPPMEVQQGEEMPAKTSAPQTVDEGEEEQRPEKKAAGM
ncbi:secretogranin-2b [Nematolebias whitei]|uniref:secretogranin-2b n=1 Tax=Nematolebias whitei TaxID=451745 RepID=UPI0018994B23|nr:secretogranin-2b [Nematolebias whitei]